MLMSRKTLSLNLLSLILAGLLQGPALAESVAPASSEAGKAHQEGAQALVKERQHLAREAVEAQEAMLTAVYQLANHDKEGAYKSLTTASGKLDVLLARDPHLSMLPVDVRASTTDLKADPKTVKETLSQARAKLSAGKIQEVRTMLEPLSSEIRISTDYMPMDTYPKAIKEATRDTQAGNTDAAAQLLADTLSTLVTRVKVIPLPPLKAETDVMEAESLFQADPVKNKQAALNLLTQASQQLEVGNLLGYGDFKTVKQEMDSVKHKVQGGSADNGLFGRLKSLLKEARSKI